MIGLNPFYIMETILIRAWRTRRPVRLRFVLIHSTSWKLFWSDLRNQGLSLEEFCLNPFYIMETILIQLIPEGSFKGPLNVLIHSTSWKLFWYEYKVVIFINTYEEVLIHSTSWKLFWFKRRIYRDKRKENSLNPFYIMETILIHYDSGKKQNVQPSVLIHSTSWKLFWCYLDTYGKGLYMKQS